MTGTTEARIRSAMANCSRGEARRMTLPGWVREVGLDPLDDVLGWRDPRSSGRGALLVDGADGLVGIALRAATGGARAAAMCALCRTTHTAGGVALFAAARSGAAGRQGDSVGTYVCADLACARHVRVEKATVALRPVPGTDVAQRRAGLRERALAFVATVTGPPVG
ncbi:MAG: FBP domain-containing protein [Pseudonocardia sp.]|nr:FBP domain-containing protein [Pseudonocardia sp.]